MPDSTSPVAPTSPGARPLSANAALVLDDGTVYWGRGAGALGTSVGEICFNTAMTGYQESLTDPSFAGQIVTFTFPHIGNVGTTPEDMETGEPAVRGCIMRADITDPSNWRSTAHFDAWLKSRKLIALTGVDTRALTQRIRDKGAPNGCLIHVDDGADIDVAACAERARDWPGLEGMDLAKDVSCEKSYEWNQSEWALGVGYSTQDNPKHHVVAVDFGAKHNILRCLASAGCRVTVVPADTSADEILGMNPDGVFLSNGPGDPAATGVYAEPMIKGILDSGKPLFGICLGHQMLARALGATTTKMHMGHRGANQPVQDLSTGIVEITSQNHGFVVMEDSLPDGVTMSHKSLFDGSVEGITLEGKPAFSVQYHPEASPGPQDSHYLFKRFTDMIEKSA